MRMVKLEYTSKTNELFRPFSCGQKYICKMEEYAKKRKRNPFFRRNFFFLKKFTQFLPNWQRLELEDVYKYYRILKIKYKTSCCGNNCNCQKCVKHLCRSAHTFLLVRMIWIGDVFPQTYFLLLKYVPTGIY